MKKYDNLYFVGAGGIGMAALERYFIAKGNCVAGYDRTPSHLTHELSKEGIKISFSDDPMEAIPTEFRNPETTLVVYTPAVPTDHPVMKYFRENGFEMAKRSKVLGIITRNSKSICVAGTHGKTSTSSMIAHIMHLSNLGCNAFLGGILRNYDSNCLINAESEYSVAEADEYDRSFHQLTPYIAVVTATDPDHLDIYHTEEAYLEAFTKFTSLIVPGGALIEHTGLKYKPQLQDGVRRYSYSRNEGDFHAENIRHSDGTIIIDFVHPAGVIRNIELGVPVDINIENSVAAMAACILAGVDKETIAKGIATFQGAKRRFEFWLKEKDGSVMIDDYAHHPDELKASIRSVKAIYPNRKLTAIFQPHLYSRTRDFAPEFADALSAADEVILLDIYPAREEPIEGVTSQLIFDKIKLKEKTLCTLNDLTKTLKMCNFDIVLTLGAGNIDTRLQEICDIVKEHHS